MSQPDDRDGGQVAGSSWWSRPDGGAAGGPTGPSPEWSRAEQGVAHMAGPAEPSVPPAVDPPVAPPPWL